jgi:hypothetical protein
MTELERQELEEEEEEEQEKEKAKRRLAEMWILFENTTKGNDMRTLVNTWNFSS